MHSVSSPSNILPLMVVLVGIACSLSSENSQLYEVKSGHRLLVVSSTLSTRSLYKCSHFCLMMEDPYCISFSYNSLTSTCQLSIYTTGGGGGVNDSTVVYQMNGFHSDPDYVFNQFSGTCYKRYSDNTARPNAVANCENDGNKLATIRTEESFLWLKSLFEAEWAEALWIGLEMVNGTWTWNGNTSDVLTYDSLWCIGFPGASSYARTRSDFCVKDTGSSGNQLRYICESAACGN